MTIAIINVMLLPALIIFTPEHTAAAQKAPEKNSKAAARPDGWSSETHGSKAAPNYDVVFPHDKVNHVTIRISPENWQVMQDNMINLYGERKAPLNGVNLTADGRPRDKGKRQGGFLRRGFSTKNPLWVPATVEFDGNKWQNVGIRYKGNLSLLNLWDSGNLNLPFKLEFDRFGDEHPEVNNQRFYGFRVLAFSSNFGDDSAMRERVAYTILKESGLVASETGFYLVQLDYGETPVTLGLYTAVEETDDTVIRRFFGEDSGNIYKADGYAANLAKGTFDNIRKSFFKKNNKKKADWSDIEALYIVLHSVERRENPMVWRSKLEAIFDVNAFLNWLAISTVIQHWDSYGSTAHNYYLYNNQKTGRLTFISWDHNRVLWEHAGDSFDKKEIGSNWPLIRYLLDDPAYYSIYINFICESSSRVFNTEKLAAQYQTITSMLAPYAVSYGNEKSFSAAVRQLTDWTYKRAKATSDFCNKKAVN